MAPPPQARTWVHPSELPTFESLSTRHQVRSRLARLLASLMLIALVLGSAVLASTARTSPPNQPMTSHLVRAVQDLPSNARDAAKSVVELTISTPGHETHVAAMVLSHDLAVTTTPISSSALLTGSVPGHEDFAVRWVARDRAMGFTIVHLSIHVPSLHFAPMPASVSVTAVAPDLSADRARFAWSSTTLGDPLLRANNLISYLVTDPATNLNGFVDAIAVDATGRAVAVLSTNQLWYSALFVARVAEIEAAGHGCHGSLGLVGQNAQGGGARVVTLLQHSPALGHVRVGDVLMRINGHDIDTWQTLSTWLYLTPAFSTAHLTLVRGTRTEHVAMTLGCAL